MQKKLVGEVLLSVSRGPFTRTCWCCHK